MCPEIKFITNEEKGIVVAIAEGCRTDAIDEILKCNANAHVLFTIFNKNMTDGIDLMVDERLFIKDTFVGVARCHPDDVFSEATGRRIACKKLHKAYNKAKYNTIKTFAKRLSRLSENINYSMQKIEDKINK